MQKARVSTGRISNRLSTSDSTAPKRKRSTPGGKKFSASTTPTQQSAQPTQQPHLHANPGGYLQGRYANLFEAGVPGISGLMAMPERTLQPPMPFTQFNSSLGSSVGADVDNFESRTRIENLQLKREHVFLTQKNQRWVLS